MSRSAARAHGNTVTRRADVGQDDERTCRVRFDREANKQQTTPNKKTNKKTRVAAHTIAARRKMPM
jgi:hypothetical protein